MGAGASYDNHYAFKKNNTVIIKHQLGKYLKPWNDDKGGETAANPDGDKNEVSEFECDLQNNGNRCRLKSKRNGKYLRIIDNGDKVDIGGSGGKFTLFKIHKMGGPGKCKLESVEFSGIIQYCLCYYHLMCI